MEAADIGQFLNNLSYWHWLIAGLGFVILEMILPGVVFLWLGIAAGLTGLVLGVQPELHWETQMLIFAVLSVISSVAGRIWVRNRPTQTDQPHLNRRGHQYIGRAFILDEPIDNGIGRLKADDSSWRISGDDAPAGTRVEVTGVDGATLQVKVVS